MGVTRVIVVSDSHLSRGAPEAQANWDAVVRYVADTAPDLVVHLGDLSLNGANELGDLRYARRQLERLAAPWRAIPGNHDIGDNPSPAVPPESVVNERRLQRWLEIVGPDYWSMRLGDWTLLAINAQLPGSRLPAEASQWSWLEAALDQNEANRPIALIGHKPMAAPADEIATAPSYRYLAPLARKRIWSLVGQTQRVPLALSGHVHQYRRLDLNGTAHVWAPTTWAVLPDAIQPTIGEKRCGILSVELNGDGQGRATLVEPAGVAQLTIAQDFPNPYEH